MFPRLKSALISRLGGGGPTISSDAGAGDICTKIKNKNSLKKTCMTGDVFPMNACSWLW